MKKLGKFLFHCYDWLACTVCAALLIVVMPFLWLYDILEELFLNMDD